MALTITVDDVDITDKVRLGEVVIAMTALRGEVGAGEIAVDDVTGAGDYVPAMKEWVAVESTASPTRIGGGFIAERELQRGPLRVASQRQFVPVLEDYNAALSDRVLRHHDAKRPAETDRQRVNWLLGTNAMQLVEEGYFPNDDNVDMDAEDYRGKTPLDVLDDCSEDSNKNFYVYWKAGTGWALYYAPTNSSNATFTSSLMISQVAADVDSSTVFGASDIKVERDPERVASGVFVEWEKGRIYVQRDATADDFRRHDVTFTKKHFKSARRARRFARNFLAEHDTESVSVELTVSVPGSALGELRAGQRIQIKLPAFGISSYTYFRITGIEIRNRAGSGGYTDVEFDVKLRLKDKVRPFRLAAVDDKPGADRADTRPHPVDRFDRTATPPTPTVGASLSPTVNNYRLEWQMSGSWSGGVYTPGTPTTPNWYNIGAHYGEAVFDRIGWNNTAHPFTPCGGGLGAMDGFAEMEHWKSIEYPDPPSGTQGMYLTIAAPDSLTGAATTYGITILARSSAPSVLGTGQVVGNIGAAGGTIYVPASFVVDGGGTFWLGYAPGWSPDHSGLWWCVHSPPAEAAMSGTAAGFGITAYKWATAASALDLGSATGTSDAPWGEAEWPWIASDVAGTYGIDGEALYATDGSVAITAVGEVEDETADWGPWSGPHMVVVEFSYTGTIGVAGARTITATSTGEGSQTIGTVSMGDASAAAYVSVAGPSSTDSAAITVAADTHYWASFDTRSGELVGKVWGASGESSDADVVADIDGTGDAGDSFTLALQATNGGGAQTVRVHSLWMAAAAHSGDRLEYEWLGFASGTTDRFRTRHRFQPGSLVAHVNGIDAAPVWEDGIEFRLDAYPTATSGIHATYIAE